MIKLGDEFKNTYGTTMIVVDIPKSGYYTVQFQDEYKYEKTICKSQLMKRKVSNPYDRKYLNFGYMGVGEYATTKDRKHTKVYRAWSNMLTRCYSKKHTDANPTYRGCKVCEEWANFQIFAKWYYDNLYFVEGDTMCLDKDLLFKGCKIYSPQTCVFLPNRINTLFVKRDGVRGDCPIGVSYIPRKKKYGIHMSIDHKHVGWGGFKTPEEAFLKYKVEKEKYIKKVAEEYKDIVPEKVYNALINYKVEITD